MKRLVILLTLLLIGSISGRAAAQEPAPAAPAAPTAPSAPAIPEQARQRLEQIKERLTLTPEQVEQVRPILADEMQKLKALRESNSGGGRRDRRKMARELKEIQGDADDRLKKVLSKEQMQELKKLREESRQQLRERAAQKRF
jgi:Spy/CpxP family protein refolding chaperone